MSIVLRHLLRDPEVQRQQVAAHPVERVLRRLEDELYNDWPITTQHRRAPSVWSPYSTDDIADALVRIQDFAHDLEQVAQRQAGLTSSSSLGNAGELAMKRSGDGSLQLAMDVSGFKPEQVKINLVDDHLVVEAKNETSAENSYSKSEIKRWFKLPQDCKVEDIKSNLTADNKLLISLPSSKPAVEPKVRSIPITVDKPKQVENGKKQDGDSKSDAKQSK